MKRDIIKRTEQKFAKIVEDRISVVKKEMRAEMASLEEKLKAQITLAENAIQTEMEEEMGAIKRSVGISVKNWKC